MKNSGIEWIGEIPDSWELVRFKDICSNKKEVAGGNSADYERLALTLNGVIKRPKDDSEGLQPKEFDGYQIIHENDFIFKMIDLQNISTSRVGLSPYTGLVSPAYIRFSPRKENQYNKFTYYFFMSMYYNCVYNSLGGNGVRSALNATDMGQFKIPYPSFEVQKKIVFFLEEKFVAIDELIANQEKQIEKLKEYKQSVITEAVTKGLDKSALMKDSRNKWLGMMPINWEVRKLKNVCELFGRIGFRGYKQEDLVEEGEGAITLSPSNMRDLGMSFSKCSYLSWEKYNESPEIQICNGDILFVKTGSTFGKVALVENLPMEATINPQIVVIKNISINTKYLLYFLSTTFIRSQIDCSVVGGTIPTISQEKILNYSILVPLKDAQQKIVKYLDNKCAKIDRLIAIKQEKIEKLQEYKKSLIYEYVTGKKEV